jgi:WD40 repeat protein/serine/threonine protein kinase
MNGPDKREETLFNAALQLATLEERMAYLKGACPDDEALRQRVLALLEGHDQADALLDKPAAGLPVKTLLINPAMIQPTEKPGDRIGRYKLLQQIGEGGCGVVYMADQEEPVKRRVALKVIKLGMDTRQVIARFEAERQALALMDHPNIAKVFDAGATETGRPFFVMELVRGIRITDYCDQNNLSAHDRLSLFTQVCHAIQHAHQKGIIHRDIKPSNILVTMHDGVPVPKVIDFGIAKATEQRLTDKTLFTAFEQFMGTPAYMSPEQAEMSGLDIDTRSDIYALGVLLYELLTGQTPFDARELLAAGLDAMRRTIREKEPARPSTCLSTMQNADLVTVARHRQSDAPKLIHLLRGDLDWIVMKALEKDRTRRYETANGLAMDLQRYLGNEPVLARPPSATYRFQKLVRRNKFAVAAASAVAAALILGLAISTWMFFREKEARQRAVAAESEQTRLHLAAAEAQKRAEDSAREVSHQLAREYVEKGAQRLNDGYFSGSLVWFTEALRLDEGNAASEAVHRLRIGAILRQLPKPPQLFLHDGEVAAATFSPDGNKLLTASLKGRAQVWNAATGQRLGLPMEHAAEVVDASFSPDGGRVLTASLDHTARIWNANTGSPATPPMQHDDMVYSAAFSPDGRRVVTASEDKTARIWNADTGEVVLPPLHHNATVWGAAFSFDSRFIVTASADNTARVWDAQTGRPVTPSLRHDGMVWCAAFSPDGSLVATASEDKTARIWNARTGAPMTPSMKHTEEVLDLAFSPDGRRLLTASGESIIRFALKHSPGEARVWDVATGKPLTPVMPHKESVFQAIFSPDGRRVATASRDKTARVWDAETGEPFTVPLEHCERVYGVAFSPDGQRLATASFDHTARIWSIPVEPLAQVELPETWLVSRLQLSPSAQLVAATYDIGLPTNRPGRVWSARTGQPVTPLPPPETNRVNHLAFSPDERLLAEAANDGGRLSDATTGAAVTPLLRHEGKVLWIAFSPDSQRVITASEDNTARIWSASTGAPLTPPMRHASNVLCAAFSPDGNKVVTTSDDKTARVWDAATGVAVTPSMKHGSSVGRAIFSPDGGSILTASSDGVTRIWDATSGRPITAPMKQGGSGFFNFGIESMAFSPDGRHFVVADSTDWSARVWDCATGTPVTPPLSHAGQVYTAAFSHNGRYLVTTCEGKAARVWDATTGQPITPPLRHSGEVDQAVFTADDDGVETVGRGDKNGFVRNWTLTPDKQSIQDLQKLARLYSLQGLDESGALVAVDFETLTNILQPFRQ